MPQCRRSLEPNSRYPARRASTVEGQRRTAVGARRRQSENPGRNCEAAQGSSRTGITRKLESGSTPQGFEGINEPGGNRRSNHRSDTRLMLFLSGAVNTGARPREHASAGRHPEPVALVHPGCPDSPALWSAFFPRAHATRRTRMHRRPRPDYSFIHNGLT